MKSSNRPSRHQSQLESVEGRTYLAAQIVGSSTAYATIQAAVNAALPGAVINVSAGTYLEAVTISKPLTLRGAQAGVDGRGTRGAESIIQATPTDLTITASGVTIDGFTIKGYKTNIGSRLGAGVVMAPGVHGTRVVNNIVRDNITGIYLANNSNTDAAVIQRNYFYNNTETGADWTYGWNGTRAIYSDGEVSGGYLTNALIDSNKFYRDDSGTGEAMIALAAQKADKQFNITISNNAFNSYRGYSSKAVLVFNTTNLTVIGNNITGQNDSSSGPLRFEGNADNVNIQYNAIYNNPGPGVCVDSAGVEGDSSGFYINYNNIYGNTMGLLTIADVYDGTVRAENNYWGATNGPSGLGTGSGQQVWANGISGHYTTPRGTAGGSMVFKPFATAAINLAAIPVPAARTGVIAAIASASQINLSWTAPMSTAFAQDVQRSTDGVNFTTLATIPPMLTTYADSGLSSLGYYYRVVATNATGNSAASNTASTVPAAPAVAAAAAGLNKNIVAWTDAAPGISNGFVIQRSTDGINFAQIGTASATTTFFIDADATAGIPYGYRVMATAVTGNSAFSAAGSVTTLASTAVPTALSSLNWVSATSGFNMPKKDLSVAANTLTLAGQTFTSGIGTHASSTIVYNLAGQYTGFSATVGVDDEVNANGTGTVRFQVVGDGRVLYDSGLIQNGKAPGLINISVTGVQSLSLVAVPDATTGDIGYAHADWAAATLYAVAPLTAPANLTAAALSPTSVKLAWTNANAAATGFIVQRSADGTTYAPLTTILIANTSTYVDVNVVAGTKYFYRVLAMSGTATSVTSNVATATTLPATAYVVPLSALSWTSATSGFGATQKNVSVAGNPITVAGTTYASGVGTHASSTIVYALGGAYTTFVSDLGFDGEVANRTVDAVTFKVIGDGVVLYDSGSLTNASGVRSVGVDVTGVTTLTLSANATVSGNIDFAHVDWAGAKLLATSVPAPTAPAGLTAAAVSASAVKLAWTNTAAAATGLLVQRSTDGTNFTTIATPAATATTYTDTNLAAGTAYSYRVLAVSGSVNSAASNTAAVTTISNTAVTTPLSTLVWTSATSGFNTVQNDASVFGNTITLRGVTYAIGLGTHAASTIVYNLAGKYKNFLTDVGIDDEVRGIGSTVFQIVGDGRVLYDSGVVTSQSAVQSVNVSVTGVQTLTLTASAVNNDIDYAHADWAGARLIS